MKRLFLMAAPLLWLAGPALAADLGPYPEERQTYERPPIVDRKIVEHHHYYHQAPTVYREKRVYVEPRIYDEPTIASDFIRAALPTRTRTGNRVTISRAPLLGAQKRS